ncbi:uncharacterized protein PV09_09377 [Verruconis gallopava]|uniref:Uncharacterized protein n=1 Tax=Verruconis gallopava TaxID=253628 RepID=A0A0D1ZWM0_9PEZI|nr:uncharacterized protein PV09_09377 [Verruconis gallopava]KIV98887.1 hypothetical protein PV09_09377 [Verruconis gallopava]
MAAFQSQAAESPATMTHAELQTILAQMSHSICTVTNQVHEYGKLLQECRSKVAEEQRICSIYESLYAAELADHAKSSQTLQKLTQVCSKLHDEIHREISPDRRRLVPPEAPESTTSEADEIYHDSAMFMELFGEELPLDCNYDDFWSPKTINGLED